MSLSPRMAAKLTNFNHYGLPVVSGQVRPTETIGPEYHEIMIAELREQAEVGQPAELWALEMVCALYDRWVEATEKLSEIQDVLGQDRVERL